MAGIAPQVKNEPVVKTEDLGAFLTASAKIMKDTLSANQNQSRSYNNPNRRCFFCGLTHFEACKNIDEYLKEGEIKKNQENQIVLPMGLYVPREIQGENLMARVDEWHRQNPNQATAILINTINKSTKANSNKHSYQLSPAERIAYLEAEIFSLKSKKPTLPRTFELALNKPGLRRWMKKKKQSKQCKKRTKIR